MKDLALEVMEQEFHLSTGQELLSWNKSDITEKAKSIVFAVAEGIEDPLETYIKIRKAKELFDESEKNLKPYIDGIKVNKGELYYGCEIIEKEQGVKYDYSGCGDQEWNLLNTQMIELSAKIKSRENLLKSITSPLETVNIETGETFTISAPIKSGKLGKSITIK